MRTLFQVQRGTYCVRVLAAFHSHRPPSLALPASLPSLPTRLLPQMLETLSAAFSKYPFILSLFLFLSQSPSFPSSLSFHLSISVPGPLPTGAAHWGTLKIIRRVSHWPRDLLTSTHLVNMKVAPTVLPICISLSCMVLSVLQDCQSHLTYSVKSSRMSPSSEEHGTWVTCMSSAAACIGIWVI